MSDTPPDPAAPAPEPTPDPDPAADPIQLPDDHPLVKTLGKLRSELSEAEKTAKANADAASQLAEIEAANQTQAEKDAKALADATKRADTAEATLARLRVATSKGLPPELADRLQGNDETEMAEDADRLLALVQPTTPTAPTGAADGGPQGADPSKPKQLTQSDLTSMSPDQILEAKAKGQFDDLLGITTT